MEHRIGAGQAVVIDPDVSHAVEALAQSEMLLTVCKEATWRPH